MANKEQGFTLAEVLIALALLGIVAAFAIPKILQSVNDTQRIATFRETLSAMNEVLEDARLNDVFSSTKDYTFFAQKLNAVKLCPTSSEAEGCWDTGIQGTPVVAEHTQPGFLLPNGAVITGFDGYVNSQGNAIYIDINGVGSPNRLGADQLYIGTCYKTPCPFIAEQKPGQILPAGSTLITTPQLVTDNQALFTRIINGS